MSMCGKYITDKLFKYKESSDVPCAGEDIIQTSNFCGCHKWAPSMPFILQKLKAFTEWLKANLQGENNFLFALVGFWFHTF